MRKSLLLVISILACFMAFSQNTSPVLVKDFVQVTTEKINKEGVPKQNWTDNDNNPICLIKVKASGFESSLMQKFMFVPNGLEITYMTQKNDQWYLYVSSNKLGDIKIIHMGEYVYSLPFKLEPNGVYEMTLGMETATLIIRATPDDAEIYIDGEKVGAGFVRKAVSIGVEHRYKVKSENYFPKEGVEIFTKNIEKTLDIDLEPNFGWITVNSDPEGADVYVDGKKVGVTPYVFEKIKRGNHKVEIKKERFATYVQMVSIQNGEQNTDLENVILEAEDVAYGFLSLYATPDGADITIDGVFKGKTPQTLELVVGKHDVILMRTGYNPSRETVEIEEGETKVINVVLVQSRSISISTDKEGDKIFVDGKYVGKSPLAVDLSFGQHEVYATRGGAENETNLVSIIKNDGVKTAKGVINVEQVGTINHMELKLLGDEVYTVNGVTFKMIAVRGGTFVMGMSSSVDEEAKGDETPLHKVTLSDYYIGEFEVTQSLWKAVMGSRKGSFKGPELPVESVSWNDCNKFIEKLNELTGGNFRLPTESEWEYAARGGEKSKGYKYSGSNVVDDVAWYTKTTHDSGTKPVGAKMPNELGIYDMSGNVWEWCYDLYDYYKILSVSDPKGPEKGDGRIVRGGSWYIEAQNARCCYRSHRKPGTADKYIGFRLAASN